MCDTRNDGFNGRINRNASGPSRLRDFRRNEDVLDAVEILNPDEREFERFLRAKSSRIEHLDDCAKRQIDFRDVIVAGEYEGPVMTPRRVRDLNEPFPGSDG